MSLFDRVRSLRPPVQAKSSSAQAAARLRWGSAAAGGAAAVLSMLVIALPVLLAWVASAQSPVAWPRALSVGSCFWLLANGAQLSSGPATISLTPWLLAAIPLAIATTAARRTLRQLPGRRPRRLKVWGGLRRDVAEVGLTFTCSYAVVGLAVALATAGDPLHAPVVDSVLGTAVVAAVSMLVAITCEFRGKLRSVAPELAKVLTARVPIHLRRAIRPGLLGAVVTFGAGLALVLAMVVIHLGRIGRLSETLGADRVGLAMLGIGQLTVLPNAAMWAASWLAGPGFAFGAGTAITWSQSNPGLLPLIPGLGAVPDPGPLPAGLWLSALVPVGAGALVGWQALRVVARLSSWQVKVKTAAWACLVAALVLTLASSLSGGALGAGRLSGVGAPSLEFGAAVLGELLLGAAVAVGIGHLRASRR